MFLSDKERKWVWELEFDYTIKEYIAVNRETAQVRNLGLTKEQADKAAGYVQAMNLKLAS